MKSRICLILLALGGILALQPAYADDGAVAVGGESLFTIHVPVDGKTIRQRVEQVEDNLVPILSEPTLKGDDVRIVPLDYSPPVRTKKGKKVVANSRVQIRVKDHFLINVTQDDGKVNGLTAMQQAQSWVKQLRIELPKLNAKPNPNNEVP